jgi:MRC1-like domain
MSYREHQTEDDARLEKEVQDVVAGKRRTRRRGGAGGLLGSDESDEEEDDEEARALRRRLAKKRRVAGDTLDALARDPATASFHATYQMALLDDAEEFAHLDRDEEIELEPSRERDEERGEESDGGDEGEEERECEQGADEDVEMAEPAQVEAEAGKRVGRREISAAEVRKTLQEVARGERVRVPLLFHYFLSHVYTPGISRDRSRGRVLDGSRTGRGKRRRRDDARAHSVLYHNIQSAASRSTPSTSPHKRRRHGRCPLPRTFSPSPFPSVHPSLY